MKRLMTSGMGAGLCLVTVTGPALAADTAASTNATEFEDRPVIERVRLGLRLGYALPLGIVEGDQVENGSVIHYGMRLRDIATSLVPIWLDAGFMASRNILVGAYGQYGFGRTSFGTGCSVPGDCSSSEMRVGVQGQYHFGPQTAVDPWLGIGVDYETLSVSNIYDGIDQSERYRCWEFANFQGGTDIELSATATVGPFLSFSAGQCFHEIISANGVEDHVGDVNPSGFHEWFMFGAKGTFGLSSR